MKTKLAVMMLVAALSVSAFAGNIAINNAGFEGISLTDGDSAYLVPGWNPYGSNGEYGTWDPDATGAIFYGYGGIAPEGENVAYLTYGEVQTAGAGTPAYPYDDAFVEVEAGISQVLAATLTANTQYTLTVAIGNSYYYFWGEGYKIQLLAGGTILAQDDNSQIVANDTYGLSTVTFDSTGTNAVLLGQNLEIRLIAKAGNGELDVDNVQLTAVTELIAIPEPITLSLFGLGALMLRRKRK